MNQSDGQFGDDHNAMVIAQLIYINVIKGQAECSRIFFAVGKDGETLRFIY